MDVVGVMAAYLLLVTVCTAQSREALCVLHSLERHCVCTAQSREALSETCWGNFKYFKYFVLILIVSTNYIFVHLLDNILFQLYFRFTQSNQQQNDNYME